LRFLAYHNEDVKAVTLKNAPDNNKLISPTIQKDIVIAAAVETSNAIIMELGDEFFFFFFFLFLLMNLMTYQQRSKWRLHCGMLIRKAVWLSAF
jgi:hypothetical protein